METIRSGSREFLRAETVLESGNFDSTPFDYGVTKLGKLEQILKRGVGAGSGAGACVQFTGAPEMLDGGARIADIAGGQS